MNERIMQFRVGVMILATILIAAILVLLFMGSTSLWRGSYTIHIRFKEAPGVTSGTPVRKAGIRIGRVRDVRLAEDDSGVIVTATIDADRRLFHDEECKTTSALLMGDAALEFVRSSKPAIPGTPVDRTEIRDGDLLQGQIPADLTTSIAGLQSQAQQTLATLDATGRDVRAAVVNLDRDMHSVLTRVDRLIERNEQRITQVIAETDETVRLAKNVLAASNDLLGDPKLREQIKETIRQMPVVLEQTRTTFQRLNGTFDSLERNMRNIEGLTEPLGKRGESLVADLDSSLQKLNTLADNMLKFSREINDPQGTLGALLHDKELYQHISHVARNLDELTRDVRPILNDVRVFTDKIARHPEMLGVRGAIRKDTGLKDSLTDDEEDASRWPMSGGARWSFGTR